MNVPRIVEIILWTAFRTFALAACSALFGVIVEWTMSGWPHMEMRYAAGAWAFVFGGAVVWLHRKNIL